MTRNALEKKKRTLGNQKKREKEKEVEAEVVRIENVVITKIVGIRALRIILLIGILES